MSMDRNPLILTLLFLIATVVAGGRDLPGDVLRLPSEASRFLKPSANDENEGTRWAILIAGSNGYWNYRHQADVCHAYQLLRKGGLKEENIVVFMYDDIAFNEENPRPGVIINSPHGDDVYKGVPKDYTGEDVTVNNFFAAILGNKSAVTGGSGKVVDSGPDDHIFIYYSDHGGPGVLGMPTNPYLYASDLIEVLKKKHASGTYKSLVFYLEACESGSIFEGLLPEGLNIYATTASNAEESSWGTYCPGENPSPPPEYETCLGDLYSVAWMEDSDIHNLRSETLHQQYQLVKQRTMNGNTIYGSHVMQYGDIGVSKNSLFLYLGTNPANDNFTFVDKNSLVPPSKAVNQRDADLVHFWDKFRKAPEGSPRKAAAEKEVMEAMSHRMYIDNSMKLVGKLLFGMEKGPEVLSSVRPAGQPLVDDWDCLKTLVRTFETYCGSLSQYGMKHMRSFANFCNAGIQKEQMAEASAQACVSVPSSPWSSLQRGFSREAPSCFPVNKSMSIGEGRVGSGLPSSKMKARKLELDSEDSKIHLYETDALKAVSTYQQKFNRSSFFTYDKLPSPTPSGDCEEEAVDMNDEVSSFSMTSSKPTLSDQLPVSSTSMDRSSSMHGSIHSKLDAVGSASYPVKSSVKSRDPRLRSVSSAGALDLNQPSMTQNVPKVEYSSTTISRKQKAVEEPSFEVAVSKRLKSSLENPDHNTTEVRTAAGNGGWLEETATTGSQLIEKNHLIEKRDAEHKNSLIFGAGNINMTSNRNEQAPVTTSNMTASLPALLKDIAVNPTMLLNILIEQQQRLAAESQKKSADSATTTLHQTSSNSALGMNPTVSAGPSLTTGFLQSSVGMLPVSSYPTSTAQSPPRDSAKIRMKPRDPRRILHGGEQFKATLSPMSNNQGTLDNVLAQKLEVRTETTSAPTQSIVQPDIARQFTSNLKNLADIMSVSQESSKHSSAPQSFSSASVPLISDRAEQKSAASNSQNLQAGIGSAPETFGSGSSRSQNKWGDLEHILDGFDEQQKAAIHIERARRMKEQNKMFAARKLCLVLDLDHTLLNSAKFVEVDPVHEEMLRKKEQEEREKPPSQRLLFRFPHMGMWTKLRPGVWNFLEKASKLFELHVYTMGNKLYATEMAKLLDPKGALFAGRVISRGDDNESLDGDAPKSKDLDGVLGMESSVVIIDDSVRVWPHHKANLIVVERYIYFPCSRRQFGLHGPSLLEIDVDERPDTGTLAASLAVIERIHQNFFASQSLEDMDVRHILECEQKKILAGCRIVFSRVVPVGEIPHLHPLWKMAEQFGAVCTNQIDEEVTHVVAGSLGTDKVNWGLSTGKFVVHPGWVEASALLYRRANEHDFPTKPL